MDQLFHIFLEKMHISILSFGFKHGLPSEADLVVDVRFAPNPYYVPETKEKPARDESAIRPLRIKNPYVDSEPASAG